MRRVEREMEQKAGGEVDSDTVAGALGVTRDQLLEARGAFYASDVPIAAEHRELDGYEPLSPDSPEERAARREEQTLARELSEQAMSVLDPRERRIVQDRVMREEALTFREIGEDLGVTRERVRQLQTRALRKMRRQLQMLDAVA
jgi:RNA polymerase sigma-32 factor